MHTQHPPPRARCPQEWCTDGSGPHGTQSAWVYVDSGCSRHDPSHLVTHRATLPLPALVHALDAHAAAARAAASSSGSGSSASSSSGSGISGGAGRWAAGSNGGTAGSSVRAYRRLLVELDGVVGHEVDAGLQVGLRCVRACVCGGGVGEAQGAHEAQGGSA